MTLSPLLLLTWQSTDGTHSSIINLAAANASLLALSPLPPACDISFDFCYDLDHVGLLILIPLSFPLPSLPPPLFTGWCIDYLLCEEWISCLHAFPFGSSLPSIPDCVSLSQACDSLVTVISQVSS